VFIHTVPKYSIHLECYSLTISVSVSSPYLRMCDNTRNNHQCTLCSQNNDLSLIQQKYFSVFLVTHTMSNMNQVMMLVQLFLLSMVKTSVATRDGCDGYYRQGVESYWNCQIYLMKWTVAAYWLIGIGILIFAFTVSRISYHFIIGNNIYGTRDAHICKEPM